MKAERAIAADIRTSTTVTTRRQFEARVTADQIRQAFGLPADARISFRANCETYHLGEHEDVEHLVAAWETTENS